jgi:hypothetical protein
MESDHVQPEELIELGAASERTLGADGKFIDYVGMMDNWGISND